jgi:hypothetical protein
MSEVLEGGTPISLIAAQILEGRYVRPRIEIEKEILASDISEKKSTLKTWVLLIALCIGGIYCFFEFSKHNVTGFAVESKEGLLMFNSTVVFYEVESEKQYTCKTNKRGDFHIRLPSGTYKFWVKDHGSLETARSKVTVDGESNYRITSFKK